MSFELNPDPELCEVHAKLLLRQLAPHCPEEQQALLQKMAALLAPPRTLGAAFAMLGCVVLWPDPHGAPFRTAVEAALRANLAYAAEVLQGARGAAADDGRREAGMASNAAEMCLRRLLLQGRGWRIGSEPANHLLAELRRLTGMATAASMAGTAAFTTAIDEQVARCQDLAERWRASLK